MPQIIPRPPSSIQETAIFKRLASPSDADGLFAKLNRFIDVVTPLLDSIISGPFKYYTLHNRDHAKKLVHLTEFIVEISTLQYLTQFECVLIIYSAYLHDMGLTIPESELKSIITSDAFANYIFDRPDLANALDNKRADLLSAPDSAKAEIELDIAELHSVVLTGFIRPQHATHDRYRRLIDQVRSCLSGDDPFSIRGVSFEEELIEICVSHNLDATVLAQMRTAHEERFPRRLVISDHIANTQFIAAVLRLTDILDFDFERTPRVLFDSLGIRDRRLPEADVTLVEWEKHLAVQQLELRNEDLVVTAVCYHPAVEATVKGFVRQIEKEIRDTLSIIRRNPADVTAKYQFCVPTTVRCEIRPRGYVYMDLSIRLDESAVTGLLMGTRLYSSKYTSVRELIQNGLDACSVRRHLGGEASYCPLVEVFDYIDEDGSTWLAVRDNGVGMTEEVLKEHFFRVGSSYYLSPNFYRLLRARNLDHIPLNARFGIGFLSVFMLGNTVQVETRRMSMLGADSVGWHVNVHQHGALAYVKVDNSLPEGTTVRVKLDKRNEEDDQEVDKIVAYLRDNILRPPIEVQVRLGEHRFIIPTKMFAKPLDLQRKGGNIPKLLKNRLRVIRIDSEVFTQHCKGPIYLILAQVHNSHLLDCKLDEKAMDLHTGGSMPNRVQIDPKWLFSNFGGNRISVGGFRMIMPRLNQLLRKGEKLIPAVYDLDLTPGPFVEFDVARTRVRDVTMRIRMELRKVVIEGLKAQGIYESLTDRAKNVLKDRARQEFWEIGSEKLRSRSSYVDDEELLEKVQKLLPIIVWPIGIHREIATQLGITRKKAFDAISTLLLSGRVSNPRDRPE